LIHALRHARDDAARELIRNAIENGGLEQLDTIVATIESTGALEYTRRLAQDEADKALMALQALPETPHKQGLAALARFAVERSS
jgi:octaprenyl-diphosphate synthase